MVNNRGNNPFILPCVQSGRVITMINSWSKYRQTKFIQNVNSVATLYAYKTYKQCLLRFYQADFLVSFTKEVSAAKLGEICVTKCRWF